MRVMARGGRHRVYPLSVYRTGRSDMHIILYKVQCTVLVPGTTTVVLVLPRNKFRLEDHTAYSRLQVIRQHV